MAEKKKISQSALKSIISSEKPLFSWSSPEFVRYKKDRKWLTYFILAVIVLTIVFALLHQWSGVIMVVVAGIVLIVLSGSKPKELNCAIYKEGFVINDHVYDYAQFKSFWLNFGDLPKIKFQQLGRFAGQITMPLGEESPEQVRLYLSKHLPEDEDRGEDVTDMINRIIRL